jgi:hypothetical protein
VRPRAHGATNSARPGRTRRDAARRRCGFVWARVTRAPARASSTPEPTSEAVRPVAAASAATAMPNAISPVCSASDSSECIVARTPLVVRRLIQISVMARMTAPGLAHPVVRSTPAIAYRASGTDANRVSPTTPARPRTPSASWVSERETLLRKPHRHEDTQGQHRQARRDDAGAQVYPKRDCRPLDNSPPLRDAARGHVVSRCLGACGATSARVRTPGLRQDNYEHPPRA